VKKTIPLGGQALIEGVMIKSPSKVAMAARTPTGKIVSNCYNHQTLTQRYKILNIPFVRGAVSLFEMMIVGMNALTWSANQQGEEEELGFWGLIFTFAMAFILVVGIFILLPYYATKLFFDPTTVTFGIVDGIIRLIVFVLYLFAIGLMKDVKTMFEYHGAEHMAVHCYENNLPLTPKNVGKFPPEHPRCGTSLLFYVVAVSIILFSAIRTDYWWINVPARILLIPLVAGISYELLKVSAKFRWLAWMGLPGLWAQKLTTRYPHNDQMEVAIVAVKKAK
jgi:uncharacterized protein YqhQ